ncbi:MAG: magnesium transporter [Methylococcales bacterium]
MANADKADDSIRKKLKEIHTLLETQKLEAEILYNRDTPRHELTESLLKRQHQSQLIQKLDRLHAADVAYILETLPLTDRLAIWDLVDPTLEGDVLLEVSDAVRETLISDMEYDELLSAAESLDTDEIADLAPDLPKKVIQKLLESLNDRNRQQLESVLRHHENSVGALMDFGMITIREDLTLKAILRYCQRLGKLPEHTNQFFVVDRNNILKGQLSLQDLLTHPADLLVREVMSIDGVQFRVAESADGAAHAFERYELVSAPVVDENNHLVGRLCVDAILDYIRQHNEEEMLNQAGLIEDEDHFSGIWNGAKNRGFWLMINILTAFLATRIIGLFENTILHFVALASLMPIVAAIGGNTGNQTSMLIIRSLALGHITASNIRKIYIKEMAIGLLNGIIWGSVVGALVYLLYQDFNLGLVMASAMLLNLLLAAFIGVSVPIARFKFELDPAMGTSVLLTFITDSMGFFIFLGLATVFLVH